MTSHFGSVEFNYPTGSTMTGSQCLPAAGAPRPSCWSASWACSVSELAARHHRLYLARRRHHVGGRSRRGDPRRRAQHGPAHGRDRRRRLGHLHPHRDEHPRRRRAAASIASTSTSARTTTWRSSRWTAPTSSPPTARPARRSPTCASPEGPRALPRPRHPAAQPLVGGHAGVIIAKPKTWPTRRPATRSPRWSPCSASYEHRADELAKTGRADPARGAPGRQHRHRRAASLTRTPCSTTSPRRRSNSIRCPRCAPPPCRRPPAPPDAERIPMRDMINRVLHRGDGARTSGSSSSARISPTSRSPARRRRA